MELFYTGTDNPYLNLAIEEILLRNFSGEFTVLSINSPSVIIGKHQVAWREVNHRFTFNSGIPVIRRISGGGAVYHDEGNLNFAFMRNSEPGRQVDFRKYTQPVIDFLASVGIDAVFGGKNDLRVNGLKISGNAEHVFRNRVLHHGTLLFSASLENMHNALSGREESYSTKGVSSNRSHVANISGLAGGISSVYNLRNALAAFLSGEARSSVPSLIPEEVLQAAAILVKEKYATWEWNYGYGPDYEYSGEINTQSGCCRVKLSVSGGIIRRIDTDCREEAGPDLRCLNGCRHYFSDIKQALLNENLHISDEELFKLF